MNPQKKGRWSGLHFAVLSGVVTLVLNVWINIRGQNYDSFFQCIDQLRFCQPNGGLIRKVFVDEDGQRHQYVVFVPYAVDSQNRPPVILYLNGFGKNGDDGIAPLLDGLAPAMWPRQREFPFVVVWAQCPKDGAWGTDGVSTKRAMAILQEVMGDYDADVDRIYLTGISSGGSGAWSMAAAYPDVFAAIAPVSAPGASEESLGKVIEAKIPVWSFLVQEDSSDLVEFNRRAHKCLLEAGVDSRCTEVSSGQQAEINAHDAWGFAFQDAAFYRWLLLQKRSERSRGERSLTLVDSKSFPAAIRCEDGEAIHSFAPRTILSSFPSSGLAEIRLEFRANLGIQRFGVGWLNAVSGSARSGMVLELPLQVAESGGIVSWPDSICMTSLLPAGAHGYLKGQWNDLRIRFEKGGVSAELNGWPLLENAAVADHREATSVGVVAQGNSDSTVEIRGLRYRTNGEEGAVSSVPIKQGVPNSVRLKKELPPASVSIEAIASAWKSWEEKNANFRLVWRNDRTGVNAASAFRSDSPPTSDSGDSDRHSMEFRGGKVRYAAAWLHPRAELTRKTGLNGNPSLQDFLRVLDSKLERTVRQAGGALRLEIAIDAESRVDQIYQPNGTGKVGVVYDSCDPWKKRLDSLDDLFWRAPLLAFRPLLLLGRELQSGEWRVSPPVSCVGGADCFTLEQTVNDDGHDYVCRFWLDPEQRFLVRRFALWVDGLPREQIDLFYSQDQNECRLASWDVISRKAPAIATSERYFPGNELLFEAARAVDVERPVESLNDVPFSDITFRQGCVVYNQKTEEWSQQADSHHRRKLSPDEVMELNVNSRASQGNNFRFHRGLGCGGMFLLGVWGILRWRIGRTRCIQRKELLPAG